MKKVLLSLILCLWLVPDCIVGQTFHAIIFANTKSPGKDGRWETGIGPSVTVDFQRMGLEMTTIAKSIGYQLKKYYYYDTPESFSRKSLERVLTNLTCNPNDIVFFFYSGHGGRAVNATDRFPEMVLKVPNGPVYDSQLYPMSDVYQRLKSKSPRLVIVMGDLCNSIVEGYYHASSASKGATVLSKGTCDTYKNLFLNVKGGLIVASSEPEETSGCYIAKIDGKRCHCGGYLTFGFLGILQHYVSQRKNVSWTTMLDNVIAWTQEQTKDKKDDKGNLIPQTPIHYCPVKVDK